MTRQDLIDHLGSIASSGTQKFVEALSDGSADSNLIGQFGVGFYSAFLVADEVTVTTKNNDDDQYIWKSTADADYTIVKDPRGNTLGRGTRITLTLKEDALEFMDQETLRDLVQRYSEFITFPIYLWAMHEEEEQVLVEKEADEAADDDEVDADDEASDDDEASAFFFFLFVVVWGQGMAVSGYWADARKPRHSSLTLPHPPLLSTV